MSFFEEALLDGEHGNELNVDFLKRHNYGVKNVFDGNNLRDFEYFDSIVNQDGHNGYKVFAAYYKQHPKINTFFTIDEAFSFFLSYPAADRIFEFIGQDFFIFMIESDHYQIFGEKKHLRKIDHYDYSDGYTKKRLEKLNKDGGRGYYQWLYDTYQHL